MPVFAGRRHLRWLPGGCETIVSRITGYKPEGEAETVMMRSMLMSGVAVLWLRAALIAQPFCESGPFRLLSPGGGPPVSNVISMVMGQSECGPLVAVWVGGRGDASSMQTSFSNDGVAWSSSQELAVFQNSECTFGPAVGLGIDGSGKVLVVWSERCGDERYSHLVSRASEDFGATWSPAADLVLDWSPYPLDYYRPVVLGLRNGGFVIVWQGDGFFTEDMAYTTHVLFSRTNESGGWQEPAFLDPPQAANAVLTEAWQSLVELDDSSLLAVFVRNTVENDGPVNSVRLVRSVDGGTSWQRFDNEVLDSLDHAEYCQLVKDSSTGRLVLAWDNHPDDIINWEESLVDGIQRLYRVYFSVSDDNGMCWSDPAVVDGGKEGLGIYISESLSRLSWRPGLGWALIRFLSDNITGETDTEVSFSDNGVDWGSPCTVDAPYRLFGGSGLTCSSDAKWHFFAMVFGTADSELDIDEPIILTELSPEPAQESIPCSVPLCGCVGGLSFVAAFMLMAAMKCCSARGRKERGGECSQAASSPQEGEIYDARCADVGCGCALDTGDVDGPAAL